MMRRRVGVAGLLVTLRGTSNRVGMAQTAGKPTHRCANRALCNRLCYCHCGVCLRGASPPLEDSLSPLLGGAFSCGQPPRRRATDDASASWVGGLAADELGLWDRRQAPL